MNLIETLEREAIDALTEMRPIPEFRPGDTLRVGVKVVEGDRTRVQNFEGVCIARSNKGVGSSFTVRKISFGEGVERVFPLYSPTIDSIEVVRRGAVRRAKLYYLRGRTRQIGPYRRAPRHASGQGHGEPAKAKAVSAQMRLKAAGPSDMESPAVAVSKELMNVIGLSGRGGRARPAMSGAKSSTSSPSGNSRWTRSRRSPASRSTGDDHRLRRHRRGAQGPEPRAFRLRRLGHRPVRRRFGDQQGPRAARRRGRLHGDRQFSSLYRMDPDVPLIVPEVNPRGDRRLSRKKNIIANPNCSTAQLVVALKPLHDAAKIKRVVVATYQSVSGAGKAGMDELFEQSRNIFVGDSNEPVKFTKQIAFNVIPHIDSFLDDGSTKEEWKMVVETKKILDPAIKVTATCVRVPVFVGHSEAVNIEFENEISAEQAQAILREAPGVMLVDKREDGGYVTPVECVGEYATFVSRVREDPTVDNGLSLWVVSDNLRKGAALNAVQIAELLGRKHLKKAA